MRESGLLAVGGRTMALALLLTGAVLSGCSESPQDAERHTIKRAIDLCWEDQKRKSLPPDQARFIAGACEKMESDYRTKYGRAP